MEAILKALDILYLLDIVEKVIIFILVITLSFGIYCLFKWFESSN